MSDEREPPSTVTTDLRVAHLTKATTRKGEIRFELHVPENDSAPNLAEDLCRGFFDRMAYVPAHDGPINVNEDDRDKSKLVVVYKPHGKRNLHEDRRAIIRVFDEMEIPITQAVATGIEQAFASLEALNQPGHAAAERARRTTKRGPNGGRGSR